MPEAPGRLHDADWSLLRCPDCRSPLERDTRRLQCTRCPAAWPVRDGLPRLYRESEVRGTDRLMRLFYDGAPRLHDPAVRYLLPLLQGDSERTLRQGYLPALELETLSAERPRILEVGIGAGANLPLLRDALAGGPGCDLFGVDISRGMLRQCERRLRRHDFAPALDVRLLMADAHRLPFPDASFDRVFHVGAAGSYRDPRAAIAEMARVAKPGTPIVVVDEQLDARQRAGLYTRAAFKLLTFYDADPHCPRELLPEAAVDRRESQVSRFYYCLSFRMP